MSMLNDHEGLLEALRTDLTPKFFATRDRDGVPNVVPLLSLLPADDGTDRLFFGNFLLRKTIKNLEQDNRVGMLLSTPTLRGWCLSGELIEFERQGPFAERQSTSPLLRYNAYTGIRNAGIVNVLHVLRSFVIGKVQLLKDFALAKAGGMRPSSRAGQPLPRAVTQEFERLQAFKVLAWTGDDGYPRVAPMLSLQPGRTGELVCWRGAEGPVDGSLVAANVLTSEAISYQVKGLWHRGPGGLGTIDVHEAYAGGPPLPGGRIV